MQIKEDEGGDSGDGESDATVRKCDYEEMLNDEMAEMTELN